LLWDTVTVTNSGLIPVAVTTISGVATPFLFNPEIIGQTIGVGESRQFVAGFLSSNAGEFRDTATVVYGNNQQTLVIPLHGVTSLSSGGRDNSLPVKFALHQNFPNPFNSTTMIRYDLPQGAFVSLTIYNVVGQKVRVLENAETSAGSHTISWDGTDDHGQPVPSGLYLVRLDSRLGIQIQKAMLIK
jgi:hypothetical protein